MLDKQCLICYPHEIKIYYYYYYYNDITFYFCNYVHLYKSIPFKLLIGLQN